ncbi:uncharacterized protein B0I36DRAFT_361521 [Microdochium trichocladiopsis]|uniref:F-box domain-containing protein n=1 Tax=Microdochium trichocladiopsis TaxID=1682393 RepID=A0A9P8Y851_9PEZI|nr:uncharacterized protein B0I36DRAFT_361521 [Microdochium trichocladiopsis]KAH7032748.1 hypothetical protein B0I36DRAFT_361521 [Microdochium trichocladiopsis]
MASELLAIGVGRGTPAAAPTPAPTSIVVPPGPSPSSPAPQTLPGLYHPSPSSSSTLNALPREILQQILSYLPYRSVISCTLVNRNLSDVCDSPLLWRRLCLDEYASWHADHCIEERLGNVEISASTESSAGGRAGSSGGSGGSAVQTRKRSVLDTDWKQLFAARKQQDRRFSESFERVLSRQDGRIDVIAQITSRGEDARDMLERLKRTGEQRSHSQHKAEWDDAVAAMEGQEVHGDDDDDSLARSYWANEILGSINRAQALREIINVISAPRGRGRPGEGRRQQQDYPLIKALWAIDYFVAETPPETLPQMLTHLDDIAAGFRAEYPGCFASSSPGSSTAYSGHAGEGAIVGRSRRQRALCLAEFVRAHDLVGVRSPETYHDLQNSLVSVALCERDHPSLPLVSHAIYCALAERVGLEAGLTNTPRHVYVTVKAPDGVSLDDEIVEPEDGQGGEDQTQQSGFAPPVNDNKDTEPKDELDPSRTMFLDPFNHEDEVQLSQLRGLYAGVMGGARAGGGVGGLLGFASLLTGGNNHMPASGPTAAELAASLAPASTRDMMFRMARNLQETLRGSVHSLAYKTALTDPTDEFVEHLTDTRRNIHDIEPTLLNPYRAGYCAWWLQTLLDEIGGLQHRALYNFVEGFMHHFKETDCPLVTDYMLTAFNGGFVSGPGAGGGEDVLGAAAEVGRDEAAFVETVLAHVRREDVRVKVPKRRGAIGQQQQQQHGASDGGGGVGGGTRDPGAGDDLHSTSESESDQATQSPSSPQQQQQQPDTETQTNPANDPSSSASSSEQQQHEQQHEQQQPWQVRYRVGDLFRHKRYRYRAVITGWDSTCQASEQWMQQMGVDSLPNGRSQSFYHVLVEDHSTRYVAQENIDLIVPHRRGRGQQSDGGGKGKGKGKGNEDGTGHDTTDGNGAGEDVTQEEGRQDGSSSSITDRGGGGGAGNNDGQADHSALGPPLDILRIAGRYFKRWDHREGRFVSNVRDEYPDD